MSQTSDLKVLSLLKKKRKRERERTREREREKKERKPENIDPELSIRCSWKL
jgi:hypothetical protein